MGILKTVNVKGEKRKISVNIGIDFGTSYTKVCFAERKTFDFITFEGSKYKPSIIYFDYKNKLLHYNKPNKTDNVEEISYFKYSMINDNLPRGDNISMQNIDVRPEILCSLFFLACLINESKIYIFKYFHKILGDIDIEWFITMGVPIDNFLNANRLLYDTVLNIANKLCISLSSYSIPISELNSYYLENQNIPIPRFQESSINTLPELYAESLEFLQSRNVMIGVYALVDVGGGTVDMAILFKEASDRFSIVSKDVKPLGIEIIANNITIDKKHIERTKNELKVKRNLTSTSFVLHDDEKKFKEEFRISFAKMIADDLKKNGIWKEGIEKALTSNNGILGIIICGGGAEYKWYEDGIMKNSGNLSKLLTIKRAFSTQGLQLHIVSINNLLPNNVTDHRLLIAYNLAKPVESIPPLAGFPWHFQEKSNIFTSDAVPDRRYYSLQERMRELYGETL